MIKTDGNIDLQYLQENDNILKIAVKSRHIKRKQFRWFIEYSPNPIGYSGIKRFCCECPNDRCTVGCYAHVATVIYYLSYARYLAEVIKPAEILSHLFIENFFLPVINEDSDED